MFVVEAFAHEGLVFPLFFISKCVHCLLVLFGLFLLHSAAATEL